MQAKSLIHKTKISYEFSSILTATFRLPNQNKSDYGKLEFSVRNPVAVGKFKSSCFVYKLALTCHSARNLQLLWNFHSGPPD
jgi:hypothetical protein